MGFSRRQLQTTRWPGGDRSTFLHPFCHERPTLIGTSQLKLCRNQWVTVDPTNLCTSCTCANLCLGRKCSWCTVRCYSTVATGAFRYQLGKHHHVGHSHPSISPATFPTRIEVSRRDRGFVSFYLSQASLVYSPNSVHSVLAFGAHTCIKNRERSNNFSLNMHTLFLSGIHSTQFSSWGLTNILRWANFADSMPT